MHENEVAKIIVDACYQIHTKLGPGLLEVVYEEVLFHELSRRGLSVKKQVPISVKRLGILVNFSGFLLKSNIKRVVNGLEE